jgi:hypothetical protein
MSRHPDWPQRLGGTLLAWQDRAPAWGTGDCGALAIAVLVALGREDLVPPPALITRSSARHALKALKALGGIGGWLSTRCPVVPASMARRGDLVVIPAGLARDDEDAGPMEAVAVVDGAHVWSMCPVAGLTRHPLAEVTDRPGVVVYSTDGSPWKP